MRASAAFFLFPFVTLASSSCALLYDFEGVGGATSSVSSTASTGSGTGDGGGGGEPKGSFLLDQCLVFGGAGDDLPARSAIAVLSTNLYFTGTFEPAATSAYFGFRLVPTEPVAKATTIGIFDGDTLSPKTFRSTAHTNAIPASFVRSGVATRVLFGGAFTGLADVYFDGSADDEANEIDGFLIKLLGASLDPMPGDTWTLPIWMSDDAVQTVVAAAENDDGDVFMLGAATQIPQLGTCGAIGNGDVPFAYLRWMNEPEVDCLDQKTFETSDEVPFDIARANVPGRMTADHVYVSLQSSSANAPSGRVVGYEASHNAKTLDPLGMSGDPGDEHFQTLGLGRIRLTAVEAGGVFTCANQEECAGGCTDATRRPGAIEVGRIDSTGYRALLTTTRVDGGRVGCNSIVVVDGAVVFGGTVEGEVVLTLGDASLTVRSAAADDTDAFLVRISPDGQHLEHRVFGGQGAQSIATLARDPLAPTSKQMFVAGATAGPMTAAECAGSIGNQDIFLMRMTVLDQAPP